MRSCSRRLSNSDSRQRTTGSHPPWGSVTGAGNAAHRAHGRSPRRLAKAHTASQGPGRRRPALGPPPVCSGSSRGGVQFACAPCSWLRGRASWAGSRRHPGVRLASASPWRAAGDARHRATRFLTHPRTPSQGASSSVFGSWGVPSAGPMRADTRVAVGGCLFRVLPWPGEAHSPLSSSLQASCHRQLRREREISFQRESL